MPTHKKKIDRDKYWALAKEQGYRSRAAFKLIQINKKHDFLSKAKVCIDLCAAPGGWCQVAAKQMPPNSVVLGIDLLPIRPIRNVKTLVSDITTSDCRSLIKKEIPPGWNADVVLCDGAPNVGAAYEKDAFVQNELALAALKTATDHLGKGGTFCSKIYRSQDYNALMWVFKQLFEEVQAIKPSSSRSQSAEIFVLCLRYRAPTSLDPRMLDPAHVFKQQDLDGVNTPLSIFDKQYGLQKRHRTGYNDALGTTLSMQRSVHDFVVCADPGQFLAEANKITFKASSGADGDHGADEAMIRMYSEHSATTSEVRECCKDLRVLNKGDFKTLLKWRLNLRAFRAELIKGQAAANGEVAEDEAKKGDALGEDGGQLEANEEEGLMGELEAKRNEARMKAKREKKKVREAMAKQRERKALGMDHNSFEAPIDDTVFSLTAIESRAQLEKASKVSLNHADESDVEAEEEMMKRKSVDDEVDVYDSDLDEEELDRIMNSKVSGMLDESYKRYLGRRKEPEIRGTKSHKRARKEVALKAAAIASEDAAAWDDKDAYAAMLNGDSGDESDGSDEDDEDEIAAIKAEANQKRKKLEGGGGGSSAAPKGGAKAKFASRPKPEGNPLLVKVAPLAEPPSAAMNRWFSDPIFQDAAEEDSGEDSGEEESGGEKDAAGASVAMPLSDKELRRQQRKKNLERRERQQKRRDAKLDLMPGLEVVSGDGSSKAPGGGGERAGGGGGDAVDAGAAMPADEEGEDGLDPGLSDAARAKALAMRAQIKAGVGAPRGQDAAAAGGDIELVQGAMPPRVDDRIYDSENEDYDSEDQVATLALGTMMLRKSRAKKLVDSGYNRYAWNDPQDLPEWFVDDEAKNYRPQLPIPKALMDTIQQRFEDLTSKPIKKVAEARARKRKRAADKLKTAKKKAEELSNATEMSDKEKLKAINKAMKQGATSKEPERPKKKLIVARKSFGGKAPRGAGKVKMVDKRLKGEKRALARNAKTKKTGKMHKKSKH